MPKKKPPAALSRDRPKLKLVKSQGKTAKGPIYQLKITLNNVKPPIWRRVLTKDCSLADLHNLIQVSMGWHDGHLHYFEVGGERFGLPEQWEQDFMDDDLPMNSCKVKLSQVIAQDFKKLKYLYDMGDGWDHRVLIEKAVDAESGVKYPRCIDGKRACPPEDCGGPWGYGDFLDAIHDPKHERHTDMVEWIGRAFDSEAFDLDETNEALAKL